MRRGKLHVLMTGLVVMALVLAGCGGGSGSSGSGQPSPSASQSQGSNTQKQQPKAEPEYQFRLGHVNTADHPYQLGAEKFKQLVEERSGGRIQIDIFPNSQLGNARDQIEGLQLGTIHFYVGSVAPAANFAPKLNALGLPYLFRDRDHAFKVLDGEIGQELTVELAGKGIEHLSFWENGWRNMTNNVRQIKTADDVKGLKIRVQEAPAYVALINALGGTPVPLSLSELYTALEQNVVDGQENPLPQIYQNKFYEVQKYLSLTRHTYDAAIFLASKNMMDRLPADLQAVIREAAKEAGAYERQVALDLEQEMLALLRQTNIEIEENPDLDSFRTAVEPVYTELRDSIDQALVDKIRNVQ